MSTETKKSDSEIVQEVLEGKWGNGAERELNLTSAGYDYVHIQTLVNDSIPKPPALTYIIIYTEMTAIEDQVVVIEGNTIQDIFRSLVDYFGEDREFFDLTTTNFSDVYEYVFWFDRKSNYYKIKSVYLVDKVLYSTNE